MAPAAASCLRVCLLSSCEFQAGPLRQGGKESSFTSSVGICELYSKVDDMADVTVDRPVTLRLCIMGASLRGAASGVLVSC